jgi:RNA polymerase sigma factor for flagellar operon FliA
MDRSTTLTASALISEHAEMARRIALKIARRTPAWVSADDLVSAAMVGLAEAADRFDAARGEPFVAFAAKRIRGEVLDELRRGDRLSRRNRVSVKKLRDCIRTLEQRLGRAPDEHEIASEAGLDVTECRELLCAVTASMATFETALAANEASDMASPHSVVERAQLTRRLDAAMANLEARDARLLALYYDEEMTYAEIGATLGVTESRVCQLHARALARLRLCLGGAAGATPAARPSKRRRAATSRPTTAQLS